MSIAIVRAVLVGSAQVTAICGDRISPLIKAQGELLPNVTLQRTEVDPKNHLSGHAGIDSTVVQLDAWAETDQEARDLADACRQAMQDAGYLMLNEFDNYEPGTDPGLYQVTQTFSVWS
jgi:hypothetical protein